MQLFKDVRTIHTSLIVFQQLGKMYLVASLCMNRPVPVARDCTSEGLSCLGGYLPTGISFHCDFFMVLS